LSSSSSSSSLCGAEVDTDQLSFIEQQSAAVINARSAAAAGNLLGIIMLACNPQAKPFCTSMCNATCAAAAGNLLGIIVLAWAGACGHTPIALCGGATGRVGDPSGRSTERPVLTEAEIQGNVEGGL
jgi:tyrosyl-tRNA synthetase